jgi:hypothetical protein
MIATIHNGCEPSYTPSFDNVDYLFTDYAVGCYDGEGTAVVRYADGSWGVHGMGHCSCYGPFDHWAPDVYDKWVDCRPNVPADLVARIEEYFNNIGEPLVIEPS